MSDHNPGTPIPICLKFLLGNSEALRKCSWHGFEVLSLGRLLSGKIAKTVIYDKARVHSGTNYDSALRHLLYFHLLYGHLLYGHLTPLGHSGLCYKLIVVFLKIILGFLVLFTILTLNFSSFFKKTNNFRGCSW